MTRPSRILQSHRWLVVVLAIFVALATVYSIVTPIFEAGDEIWHFPFVQHLAAGNSLPIQNPAVKTLWEQEGGQPPLYYALGAALTFWIDTSDLRDRLWLNPHAKIGIPLVQGNKNMVVHTSAEDFPWRNTALAVHLLRFFSILLSALTVAFAYFLALEFKADQSFAALVAALVAFNPMFLFISASVNNDNLAVMLATLALWLLVRLVRRGATMEQFIALGIVLGFAALTKVSNLGLLVLAAVVFLYLWSHSGTREVSKNLTGLCVSAALVVAIAGWWYARNWLLYGDPLAFNVWVEIAGKRLIPLTLQGLVAEFQGFRISFWGNFGGVNIIAPEWVYIVLDAVTLLAIFGLVIGLVRRTLPRLLALPTLWVALICLSLVRWTMLTLASQGRLIFPAISAIALLLTCGLRELRVSYPAVRLLPSAFALFLLAFSLLTPFALIAPTFALPPRYADESGVPNLTRIVFEEQAELVGYDLPQRSVAPGAQLPLTIYWRARAPMVEDYSVYLHLFDAAGNVVGQWDAFPGGGLYPTRLWQVGQVIADSYAVPITVTARGPSVGRVEVGLYRRATLQNLVARDPGNRVITPTIARFKIAGQGEVRVENPVNYNFGDKVALVGYSVSENATAGSSMRVNLYWRARAPMTTDYTVFVHLVDAGGRLIAQKDDQPNRGAYPTSFWDRNEVVADEYVVTLPARETGDYRILVGMYSAGDGTRLPVQGGGDFVDIGPVRVTP